MFKFAVAEIFGRQYKIIPKREVEVDYLGDIKSLECKVLAMATDTEFQVGNPYLDQKITLEVLRSVKKAKIRVATYKAKANTRKVKGARAIMSKVIYLPA